MKLSALLYRCLLLWVGFVLYGCIGIHDQDAIPVENETDRTEDSLSEYNDNDSDVPEQSAACDCLEHFCVPQGSTIDSANLVLGVFTTASQEVTLHRITKPWSESNASWEGFESSYDAVAEASFNPTAMKLVSVDITPLVQGWVNGDYPNYGLLLKESIHNYTDYYSSEYPDPDMWPRVEICHSKGSVTRCGVISDKTYGIEDTFVSELEPSMVGGYSELLYTGNVGGGEKQTLLQWDLCVAEPQTCTIGDFVWHDLDADGFQDIDEPGVGGVAVVARDCDGGIVASSSTNEEGLYLVDVPCGGQYALEFFVPDGLEVTLADQGTDDLLDSDVDPETYMTACFEVNGEETNIDVGLLEKLNEDPYECEIPQADCDCQEDFCLPRGTTIDSATLTLHVLASSGQEVSLHRITEPWSERCTSWKTFDDSYDSNIEATFTPTLAGPVSVDITSLVQAWIDGDYPNYGLLLTEGIDHYSDYYSSEYPDSALWPRVEICYPKGGVSTCEFIWDQTYGLADTFLSEMEPTMIGGFSDLLYTGRSGLAEKQALLQWEVCLFEPTYCTIGDFVWQDQNANGIQDEDEPGLADVAVEVTNCAGEIIATDTTDENGEYLIEVPCGGQYAVEFSVPEGFVVTTPAQGVDPDLDSDVDPETNMSTCIEIIGENSSVDMGLQEEQNEDPDDNDDSAKTGRVLTILLTMSNPRMLQYPGDVVSQLIKNSVNWVLDNQVGSVLIVRDDNHRNEFAEDPAFIQFTMLGFGISADLMDEPQDGLRLEDIEDYDLVWFSNPGYAIDDLQTRQTLLQFSQAGGGLILQGDDMSQQADMQPLTHLEFIDNGTSYCGVKTDNNLYDDYYVTTVSDEHPVLEGIQEVSFRYGDDIDSSIALGQGETVLAWANVNAHCNSCPPKPVIVALDAQDLP